MTDPKARPEIPGLKTLIEDVLGIQVDDAMKARIEQGFATTYDDDPERWTDVKRTLALDAGEDPEAEGLVDAQVDGLDAELRGATEPPATWTPDERAIYATRRVESALEEGGPEGLRSEARAWVPHAVAGYRLLALADHAAVTERIGAAIEGALDEESQNGLMEDWFNLENADGVRAAWIRSHPGAFRS